MADSRFGVTAQLALPDTLGTPVPAGEDDDLPGTLASELKTRHTRHSNHSVTAIALTYGT